MLHQAINLDLPLNTVDEGIALLQRRLGRDANIIFRDGASLTEIQRERFEQDDPQIRRHLFVLTYSDGAKGLLAFENTTTLFSFYFFQDENVWNYHNGELLGPIPGDFDVVKDGMSSLAGELNESCTVTTNYHAQSKILFKSQRDGAS